MKFNEQEGSFEVLCNEKLFGTKEIELSYILYQRENENLLKYLSFIQKHYRKMYDSVLKSLLIAYRKNPKWGIWNEGTETVLRVDLHTKEEVHNYIGLPTIEIMSYEKQILFGLSFWKDNKMSIEHGFCAVFEHCNLLLIGDSDFCNILYYWNYHDSFNLIKEVPLFKRKER